LDVFCFSGAFADVRQLIEDIALFTQNRQLVGNLKFASRGKKLPNLQKDVGNFILQIL